jgi:hypothetical protein
MKPGALAFAAALALCAGTAQAQVVADSACEKYAVDIAAFATCDSPTRVARAEVEKEDAAAPRPDRKTQEKRQETQQAPKKATARPASVVKR